MLMCDLPVAYAVAATHCLVHAWQWCRLRERITLGTDLPGISGSSFVTGLFLRGTVLHNQQARPCIVYWCSEHQ
jgi:hypothetical protein